MNSLFHFLSKKILCLSFSFLFLITGCGETVKKVEGLRHVSVPSSQTHGPNSTWWGYNMSKVVRHGDVVYFGVIENDTGVSSDLAEFNVYRLKSGAFKKKVSVPASRPGNLLVDSDGGLHVIAFEPIDISGWDSAGSLIHYFYEGAVENNFSLTEKVTIIEADHSYDLSVNIRTGATISKNDKLAVAYGAPSRSGYAGKILVLHTKLPGEPWQENVLEDVEHEYYYPFLVQKENDTFILPVQDDFVGREDGSAFNRYYKIPLFTFSGGDWNSEMLIDVSTHSLALNDEEPQLVEQSDLFEKSNGRMVAIYKDRRHSQVRFYMREISAQGEVGKSQELKWARGKNWVRAFEIESKLYFFMNSWDSAHFVRASDGKSIEVELPSFQKGVYPYFSSNRGGIHQNQTATLDFYAISGSSSLYPSPGAKLYEIPKRSIKKLF
jgi:hypothetical protein